MQKSKTWVVKLGGAMMRAPELPAWLRVCFDGSGDVCVVVVVGGGSLADAVRDLHACWQFEESLGHELALQAMRMNAEVLAAMAPRARACSGVASLGRGLAAGADLLWHPPRPFDTPSLPKSWQATSDSIALWLGQELAADAVVLVKSLPENRLSDARAGALSAAGVVDAHFPSLLQRTHVPVRIVSKFSDQRFRQARIDGAGIPGCRVD